jgi:DNA-binding CsgD family transcriptional regulator
VTASALVGPSPSGGGPAAPSDKFRALPRRPKDARTYVTAREIAVLRLAANGATSQAMANALGISKEGVLSRMQSAFRKLRVGDRTQAVAVALRLGLLSLDDVVVPDGANRGCGDAV